ncbi:MAG: MBL fold metallo-hydrolase, partial [Gammaproteobacteria bacterium]|nr:MBL fold metallo-hydrolase [Gammaproteobacteria bacterium]
MNTESQQPFDARAFLKTVTSQPGVYRMFDAEDKILYVGKAKNLKNRLGSYFRSTGLSPKTQVMVRHIDHIEGVAALRTEFPDIKVYIHKLDAKMLTEPQANLSVMTGAAFSVEPADFFLEEESVIEQAGIKLSVLHTPGHTPGGICLYCKDEGVVFTNDTLFADSIGRTDFPNGNIEHLLQSIREKLFTLPDETKVYPGHGPQTTIAEE